MAFDFQKQLEKGCDLMQLELSKDGAENLFTYFTELKKWSKKVNLIAKGTGDEQSLENHFLDSLALLSFLPETSGLVDIGTGAGFPGLVCKAAQPDLKLFLVEPRVKRVSFLKHVVRTLRLGDVQFFCNRIEDEPELLTHPEVTSVTCRAVIDIEGFVRMTDGFSPSVDRVCLKGPKWQEELGEAKSALEDSGLQVGRVVEYNLPFSLAERAILVLKKAR